MHKRHALHLSWTVGDNANRLCSRWWRWTSQFRAKPNVLLHVMFVWDDVKHRIAAHTPLSRLAPCFPKSTLNIYARRRWCWTADTSHTLPKMGRLYTSRYNLNLDNCHAYRCTHLKRKEGQHNEHIYVGDKVNYLPSDSRYQERFAPKPTWMTIFSKRQLLHPDVSYCITYVSAPSTWRKATCNTLTFV